MWFDLMNELDLGSKPKPKYNYRFSLELSSGELFKPDIFMSVIHDALLLYHAKTGQEFSYKNTCLTFDEKRLNIGRTDKK